MADDPLTRLQRWYAAQCNGDWEHSYGIHVGTLDNPGWTLDIDLIGTALGDLRIGWTKAERSDTAWLHWRIDDGRFSAACGPMGLGEAISVFLELAEAARVRPPAEY